MPVGPVRGADVSVNPRDALKAARLFLRRLARDVGISRLEDEAKLYMVYSLEVLFDLVGVAWVLYLFVECQLEVLLGLVGVFSLYVVY